MAIGGVQLCQVARFSYGFDVLFILITDLRNDLTPSSRLHQLDITIYLIIMQLLFTLFISMCMHLFYAYIQSNIYV